MSIAQYEGRRIDVLAFQGVAPAGERRLTQALAMPGTSGEICTGIQKLAQRVLIELLTERGSMPFAPRRGTSLMTRARLGYLRDQLDVFTAVSAALLDMQESLWEEESDDDPDDECYGSAEVLSVVVLADLLRIYLKVFSRAGTSREVILPISTPIVRRD